CVGHLRGTNAAAGRPRAYPVGPTATARGTTRSAGCGPHRTNVVRMRHAWPVMGAQRDESGNSTPPRGGSTTRARARELVVRTVVKAWDGNVFSEAAEGAFWQTLSLPPLLLALLGCLGFVGDWFGPQVVHA